MSDTQVVCDCLQGKGEQFSILYDKYIQKVYGFVFHKVLHKELAEDITSDIFLKVLEKLHTFDSAKASFPTWIFRIARNVVIDHFRTFRQEIDIDDIWDIASAEDIQADADARQTYDVLRNHLQKLTACQREILMMHFWQGMSYKEIAEIFGKTEASIKMDASRGIAKLRKEFFLFLLLPFLSFIL